MKNVCHIKYFINLLQPTFINNKAMLLQYPVSLCPCDQKNEVDLNVTYVMYANGIVSVSVVGLASEGSATKDDTSFSL